MTQRIVRHPPSSAKTKILYLFLRLERGHPPRWGAGSPVVDAARAERRPSRLLDGRDRTII